MEWWGKAGNDCWEVDRQLEKTAQKIRRLNWALEDEANRAGKKKHNSPGGGNSVFKKPKSMKQHCKGFVMLGHRACEGQVTGG